MARLRLGLYRAVRSFALVIEPREVPAHLAAQLERGEIVWRAFVDAGIALRRSGRFDEADVMLASGLSTFPGDATLLFEYAHSAHSAGRYAIAVERWRAARTAQPDNAMCWSGVCGNLRELGQLEAAAMDMDVALERFPNDIGIVSEAARLADRRFQFEDSLRLWAKAMSNYNPEALLGHAHTLVLLGRFDEAATEIEAARRRHPDDMCLDALEGTLISAREDWPKAVAFWTAYRVRYPDDGTGVENLGRAQLAMAMMEAEQEAPHRQARDRVVTKATPPKVERVDNEAMRDLLLGFESLGDNCEFGSVQRRYGAEPLGLLRWNNVAFDSLLPALAHRFEGMGLPENTEVSVWGSGEYMVCDRRWGLYMHTFLFASQIDRDALFSKMCKRVTYLRNKLVADLTAAEKIFVYRSPGLDADRLEALHDALSALGPVRLLNVQPAAPTAPTMFQGGAGEVVEVAPRRYVGFLERLGVTEMGTWDIAFDDWVAICRRCAAASM